MSACLGVQTGLLSTSNDWELRVNLGKQFKFPAQITETQLRPDIVLFSTKTKQVVMIELTVPWEDRMEESNEREK